MTAEKHYITSIEQADGRFDLERNVNNGDAGDFSMQAIRTSLMTLQFPIPSVEWNKLRF
jgi:hypothetical protein